MHGYATDGAHHCHLVLRFVAGRRARLAPAGLTHRIQQVTSLLAKHIQTLPDPLLKLNKGLTAAICQIAMKIMSKFLTNRAGHNQPSALCVCFFAFYAGWHDFCMLRM